MKASADYLPHALFASGARSDLPPPRVYISPQRYVQGPGVLDLIGRYLALIPASRVALMMSERGLRSDGARLAEGLRSAGIEHVTSPFGGECSLEAIGEHVAALAEERVDCLVAAGGGKCVDTAKAVAHRLEVPVVVVPTLASNDAPCSAVSVIYTPEGVSSGVEFYPCNPAIVVVDTEIVAAAPERYLVAGMGDAMATWYEARVCLENESARTTVGARPTLASAAIGEICATTLFDRGVAAGVAVREGRVDTALEAVVEANTLLSGVGFESGGLAAAHGVAQACTALPAVRSNHLHGEMVAIGTLVQLMLESRPEEASRVAEFFARVGLPVHLEQLSLDPDDRGSRDVLVDGTLAFPFIQNMPERVTPERVRDALAEVDRLGRSVAEKSGDEAFRRLQRA
jgi:glycerol dehydrogenase